MRQTANPNFVLGAIVTIILFTLGLLVFLTQADPMSAGHVTIMIALVSPTIVALLALLKAEQGLQETKDTKDLVNGRMDQLIETEKELAKELKHNR
jgi:hypothetical protein